MYILISDAFVVYMDLNIILKMYKRVERSHHYNAHIANT